MLSHTASPNQGGASLANTTNSGSLASAHHRPTSPIRAQLLSGASVPWSPPPMIGIGRLGRPPPYTPPARSVRSATMDANIHQHQIGRLATPYMSSSGVSNTEELPWSHPTNTRLGCTMEMTPGAVWAPVGRTHLSRDGPSPLYTHGISHPNWQSGANYGSIVDWRSTRVITDDTSALSFNNVCRAARSLNYLDH
ncbi:uncharacterized protein MELLADRAFT_113382 [Melampsora larici-populina 98AG31]|uniref:Uncharacterized protein n=1 Tax=Melampsora larici-populina (strain 98AG31 / pathotype 3-4-7) TaxID=747676 RepID=F4S9P2_MELLP|nr:uncharacterized protein MELLADRAFT_113382 [Melampsora larici-populina 98AG31]EGF98635.1 hypothetical protein MELLADRAFT_113382 [Melampsora larici-populina 98AG31]